MYPSIKKALTEAVDRLEYLDEIYAGAGEIILSELPPSGSLPQAMAALYTAVYGAPDVPGESSGRPASNWLRGEAPSLKMPPVPATLFRLGLTRDDDNESLSRIWVGLMPLPPGPLASTIVTRLYDDSNSHLLKRPQGPGPMETRALAAIEALGEYFASSVDLPALASQWSDLGRGPRHEACRTIARRLKKEKHWASDL